MLAGMTNISESPEDIMVDERRQRESLDREVKADRRRPGRVEYSNAALIRMMRGTYGATIHELHRIEDDKAGAPDAERASKSRAPDRDDLRVARGVVFGVAISAAFWLVIGSAIWVLLRIV